MGSVVLAVVLVTVASASVINVHFGQYPTVGSALGDNGVSNQPISTVAAGPGAPAEPPITESTWTAPPDIPARGTTYSVTIPAPVSGYEAAPALVYLPPAYLGTPKAANLPVLVLLHGLPGAPVDWLNGGELAQMMDAYAAAHHGLAPIVILPDITNNGASNPPLCMDTTISRSATYLAVDLPAWVKTTLGAGTTSAQQWAVAGFSYGGTCTMQLATNFPGTYPTFIDISGETEPTVPGGRPALISTYFSGDPSAFAAQNALDKLAVGSFGSSSGIVVTGAQDTTYAPQGQKVYEAAKASGMSVTLQVLPGGHSWQVWKPGLQNNLDWLTGRLGLTGPS
ncbi:esterase family protein [Arthrobacter sp. B1805]|uniref:alpha/beta hydrolase n=1 Tax=Arthrobacter sp. B1805 TaxID=2058892 RepID=UPI0015E448D7|nr:alpha/beta fold hydrolase [Arthrobacter sp. B1805]